MAKKQTRTEIEEQKVEPRQLKRFKVKKMKYHPVARYKGCINCE